MKPEIFLKSYPTLNFDLGEDIDMLRDTVQNFASREIAPRAVEIDHNERIPNGPLAKTR